MILRRLTSQKQMAKTENRKNLRKRSMKKLKEKNSKIVTMDILVEKALITRHGATFLKRH